MTNGGLLKVESIAFCNIFVLHLVIIGIENQFSLFLRVVVLHRFYYIVWLLAINLEPSQGTWELVPLLRGKVIVQNMVCRCPA